MAIALEKLREEIREVDDQILKLVSKRLELVKKIGEIKRKRGLPIVDSNVEKEVIERALVSSREFGLDRDFTVKLVNLLIAEAVRLQEKSFKDKT